ncbi:NAD(P)-dependent dehydrogenase, short-chain alcohol dehydrogenase family [Lentzea fradiae]|uniref:NAD(P)-dependent dehydrogenase, short-chain alcohol dehydrogenase family n=1 Tax=Lentzea fradiae TaxID=200378 RepID=A0A1G7KXQ9_9PSEU|nr:SDR family oxidoreductase [Lentzea fradiae]SDF41680.1 NAD(P)-dependent dehydrogenase, short-chain alcohol dehydrogenase family [Lentzea fradiae]
MGQLAGKIAVVTGGSAGIGLATARRFVAEGARVFVTGRRPDALAAASAELGPAVTAVPGDAADPADLDRLRAAVAEHGRGLDVVFANAGGGEFAPLGGISLDQYDDVMTGNARGVLFTVQTLLPLLNPNASLILMSSIAGTAGMDGLSVYGAAKAAVRSFARTFAVELGDRGVRVNAISPGYILTKPDDPAATAYQEDGAASIPLRRVGQPEEVAAAALFLASSESSYVTGIELFVDGGRNQV